MFDLRYLLRALTYSGYLHIREMARKLSVCLSSITHRGMMVAYQKEKRDNAICFFAKEHKARSGSSLPQTYLYKYLAFLDFLTVKKTGLPSIGLQYKAMKMGPVPTAIYNSRHNLKTELYEFRNEGLSVFTIEAKGEPNLDFFSPLEIEIMARLVEKYAKKYGKAQEISEDSHKHIKAWKETYSQSPNGMIDYALMFDSDIRTKPESQLTHAEECYLTYLKTKHASKCSPAR